MTGGPNDEDWWVCKVEAETGSVSDRVWPWENPARGYSRTLYLALYHYHEQLDFWAELCNVDVKDVFGICGMRSL